MTEQAPATPPRQEDIDQGDDDDQRVDDAQRAPDEHPSSAQRDDDQGDDQRNDDEGDDDQRDDDTFPRSYVQRLRERSNGYRLQLRERESDVDTLQRQLFAERLQRLDLVIDHDAVPYDPALLDEPNALQEHVEQLLDAKPYLRKRKVSGNIGQHSNTSDKGGFSLLDAMRANAQ